MDRRGAPEAAFKHLSRVWSLSEKIAEMVPDTPGQGDEDLLRAMHKTIFDVTQGVESFGFNAAIAKLYAFTNTLAKSNRRPRRQTRSSHDIGPAYGPNDPAPGRRHLGGAGR